MSGSPDAARRFAPLSFVALVAVLQACTDQAGPTALPAHATPSVVFVGTSTPARIVAGIYLVDATGANIVRLTKGSTPVWSPDGSVIAFGRDGNIALIHVASHRETILVKGTQPTWSPDGKRIAFRSVEGISVMNADGSDVRMLIRHLFRDDTYLPSDMGISNPAWSPDGQRIAFQHLGDGETQPGQVYIMNADGSNPVRLSAAYTNRSTESDPAWSPDGRRIVFSGYGPGIGIANLDTGLHERFYAQVSYGSFGTGLSWSPDGKLVALNIYPSGPTAAPDILLLPVNGGTVQTLISNGYDASWSPDGRRIAFVRNRVGKTN